jgi:hypothetical protein
MTRPQEVLLGAVVAVVAVVALIFAVGYFSTSDFRERKAVLKPLLATNAPLSNVVAQAGAFTVTRRGTPGWTQMASRYQAGSKWDKHIAGKMETAAAVGHTSTMWMQTWIFLDERDRLVDFELGTQ